MLNSIYRHIHWPITSAAIVMPIMLFGLMAISSFGDINSLMYKQLIWILISMSAIFIFANIKYSIMSRSAASMGVYGLAGILLMALFILGKVTNGAKSWLHIGLVSFQPADLMKLALIMLLAKYFSKRHVDIRQFNGFEKKQNNSVYHGSASI